MRFCAHGASTVNKRSECTGTVGQMKRVNVMYALQRNCRNDKSRDKRRMVVLLSAENPIQLGYYPSNFVSVRPNFSQWHTARSFYRRPKRALPEIVRQDFT